MKVFRKSLLLALCLVFLLPVLAYGATYSDIEGHWAEEAIERWSGLKVIEGYNGKFRPDEGITRGEMAAILDRTLCYTETAANTFSDLADTDWYTEYVLRLNAAGVMEGYNGYARPNDGITRQEAMVMMARALGYDSNFPADAVLPYADSAQVADWALPAILTLQAGGYITDSTDQLRPEEYITRAEVVNLLNNLIGGLWRSSGLYVDTCFGNGVIAAEQAQLLNTTVNGDLIIVGPTKTVILENTQINGTIHNLAGAEIRVYEDGVENSEELFFGTKVVDVLPDVEKNSYRSTDFLSTDDKKVYVAGEGSIGIDVSEHNGEIDWDAVAEDGIEYVIIRLGYRGSTRGDIYLDEKFEENLAGAQEAGLDVGVYFFSQAISTAEAIEEAEFVLDTLRGEDLEYPVYFDWEYMGQADARTNGISRETLTACADAFCERIEQDDYVPGVYLYGDLAYMSYQLDALTDYTWWFAGYYTNPDFYYDFEMWQYSSSGSVAGISTKVDMNVCMGL